MNWIDLKKDIDYLNSDDLFSIYQDEIALKEKAEELGYTINEFLPIENNKSIQIVDISSILQKVENNIDILNSQDFESIYFIENQNYLSKQYFRKTDYSRWVDILNEIYAILNGEQPKWAILILADGSIAKTENNSYITIRGDFVVEE